MLESLAEMLSYPFMQRAVAVGLPVCLCAALLGVILVLKNLSMIGDGLSHLSFGAIAVALAANLAPLQVAVPVVLCAAFLLMHLRGRARLRGDAAIAILSCGALAVGVMAISVIPGVNVDISGYMFGSILAMSSEDVWISLALSCAVLVLYVLFYPRIFAVAFDEDFARAGGIRAEAYVFLVAALTAVTVVVGMRLMGAMLISSLIIFPAVSAMRVCKSFRAVVLFAAAVAVVCFACGISVSYFLAAPAGASIVCTHVLCLGLCALAGALRARTGR